MAEHKPSEENVANPATAQLGLDTTQEFEQHCLLFPSYASRHNQNGELTDNWNLCVRGWAFSVSKNSRTRDVFLDLASWATGIKKDDPKYEFLEERSKLFWANNMHRGEFTVQVVGLTDASKIEMDGDPNASDTHAAKQDGNEVKQLVSNAEQIHVLEHPIWETKSITITPKEGAFTGILEMPKDVVDKWVAKEKGGGFIQNITNFLIPGSNNAATDSKTRVLKIQAYHKENRIPAYGIVNLVEPEGFSIITDIDDTIKETNILEGFKTVFSNTFIKEFKDVQGMSNLYRKLYGKGAAVHYVSNGPWQLFPMTRGFFQTYEFPPGSAHLKFYDGILKSAYQQKENPMASKLFYIRELLKSFPQRKFFLFGDSGELDPEVYTTIIRESPDRIVRIFIRDVTTPRIKDLPAQPAHHSYLQTFPSLVNHLYRSHSDQEDQPTKTEAPAPTPALKAELPEHETLQRSHSLYSTFHDELSHLIGGITTSGLASVDGPEIPADLVPSTANQKDDQWKTPLEMFHERIAKVSDGLAPGVFNLFTDPAEIEKDEAVKKAFYI